MFYYCGANKIIIVHLVEFLCLAKILETREIEFECTINHFLFAFLYLL